jgi:hypothetical protein
VYEQIVHALIENLDAICFASFHLQTLNLSPAVAAPSRPNTDTGVEGPATLTNVIFHHAWL